MEIKFQKEDEYLIVEVKSHDLDEKNTSYFKEKMNEALEDHPPYLIMDLSSVNFISSSGIGSITVVYKKISVAKITKFCLMITSENIRQLFKITGLDQYIRIFDSMENAKKGILSEEKLL